MARDYTRERLIEKPARKKERAARNRARLVAEKALGAAALKGKDVHHAGGTVTEKPKLADLRVVKPAVHNHGRAGAQGGKLKGGK